MVTEDVIPELAEEFDAWKLRTGHPEGSLPEVFVKTSIPSHVNPVEYKDKFGDARFVVHLTIVDASGNAYTASATAIASDLLLTAGHVVRDNGKEHRIDRAAQIEARIGYHNQGSLKGQNVEIRYGTGAAVLHKRETSGWDRRWDMALIKLESPFQDLIPASYKATPSGKIEVSVLGFPSEVPKQVGSSSPSSVQSGCMYIAKGCATTNEKAGMLEYKISTATGNSGGPVVLRDDPKMVVATHSSGDKSAEINYAVPVNVDFINRGTKILREEILTFKQHTFLLPGIFPTPGIVDVTDMVEFDMMANRRQSYTSGTSTDTNLETGYGVAKSADKTRGTILSLLRYIWHHPILEQRVRLGSILLLLALIILCIVLALIAGTYLGVSQ